MKVSDFIVERVRPLNADSVEMMLSGDTSAITAPGQFVNIALPGRFLRRPLSVCDWDAQSLTLLIRVAGEGTKQLASLAPGTALDVITGLGNGFDVPAVPGNVVLAGGGIGIAPLYGLAKALVRRGLSPLAALGFRTRGDAFYLDAFRALGCEIAVATEDGSLGTRGRVTDLLRDCSRTYVCCCGPLPMLKAVSAASGWTGGQYSFEARMGCGFGACMGCSMPFKGGWKRVCKDGPVFLQEDLPWICP